MALTTIRLYGAMGARFGRVHRAHLDTNTPAEAVRYLCSQFPAARAYMTGAKDKGVGFAVFRGKENIGEKNLQEPVGSDDIRIAPILMGSKQGGILQIIVGIVLIAVSFLSWWSGPVAAGIFVAGVGMIAGGVVQLLTPVPKGAKSRDSPANAPSYVFNGAVNTQAQGNPAPLLYGRMIVGSAVISAGINVEDYSPVSAGVGLGGGGGTWHPKTPYEAVP